MPKTIPQKRILTTAWIIILVTVLFTASCSRGDGGGSQLGSLRIEYAKESAEASESLNLKTRDNINISAIDLGGDFNQAVILLHYLNGSKEDLLTVGDFLKQNQFRVLLLDFRGHGKSEGQLSENYYEIVYDIEAVHNYIQNKTDIKDISLVGVGLGANAALGYETNFKNTAKIILVSPQEEYGDFGIGGIRWVKKPILIISASGDQLFKDILDVKEEISEESRSFSETEVIIDYKNQTGREVLENRKDLQEKVIEFLRA